MNMFPRACKSERRQSGYALLLVVFVTTMMLITVMIAAPVIRTEQQREKEKEMIWRGKQYVRGIKLFYRKTGHFPTSLDDLTKPKVGSLRFMRQKYKDPMNREDGEWRLIYVGPTGQLIGSLKPQQNFLIPGLNAGPPAVAPSTPGGPQGTSFGSSSFGSSGSGSSAFGSSSFGQPPSQQPGVPGGQAQAGASPNKDSSNSAPTDDSASVQASASTNPVIGGSIIGVGSKVNKHSIIVYDKAKNYRLFEFVWNPSKDLMNALGQPGAPAGTPTGTPSTGFGQSGFGQSTNPPAGVPQASPTPQPQQPPPQQQP